GPDRDLVDELPRARTGGERRGWIALRLTRLDGAALGLPSVEAAVQHRRPVEAERAEHPPDPGGPHHGADAVEHDAGAVPEAVSAEGARQVPGRRHRELELRVGRRKLALEVEEVGPRDMPGDE